MYRGYRTMKRTRYNMSKTLKKMHDKIAGGRTSHKKRALAYASLSRHKNKLHGKPKFSLYGNRNKNKRTGRTAKYIWKRNQ